MNFHLLELFVRSASFELDNNDIYCTKEPYHVFLNGKKVLSDRTENVFSLYHLKPNTHYTVELVSGNQKERVTFCTPEETVLLDVRDFGAVGNGKDSAAASLQAAVLSCPAGGTVYVPKGVFLSGPLFLKSGITLYLDEGAVILGETDRSKYPILPGVTTCANETDEYYLGTWEGNPLDSFASLLTGIEVKDVNITGQGIVDANAENGDWWTNVKEKRGAWRPRMLFLCRCSNIRVQGVTFRNSYAWTIHPYFSSYIRFLNISVKNDACSPNTDGIDPESCKDVHIIGARISVGDDCIAIKSGKRFMGEKLKTPSSDILIRNCLLERGHGGIVIGSEVSGGVHNVQVRQCLLKNTDRGLRTKTRRGRGRNCNLDGILFENVQMDGVMTPFVINMFYFCDPDGHTDYVRDKSAHEVNEETPHIGTLVCRNITCTNCSIAGAFFYGLPEVPIDCVELENVFISFRPDAQAGYPAMMDDIEQIKKLGLFAYNLKKLSLKNVKIKGYEGKRVLTNAIGQISEEE